MNLINLSPVAAVTAIGFLILPAQAFSIGGDPSYSNSGLPNELSVDNEVHIEDSDTQFTVLNAAALNIGSLFLEGALGEFGLADNSTYTAVPSYITGFEFLGQEVTFNLHAGENILAGFTSSSHFTLASEISGDIVDLDGNLLGTATGNLSSVQTNNQSGNFSITLDGTPTHPDTTNSESVPAPDVLPGLIIVAISACWKYNHKRHCNTRQQLS